jgi:hypothetical protein
MMAAAVVLPQRHSIAGLPVDSKRLGPDTIQALAAPIEEAALFAWVGSLDTVGSMRWVSARHECSSGKRRLRPSAPCYTLSPLSLTAASRTADRRWVKTEWLRASRYEAYQSARVNGSRVGPLSGLYSSVW